MPSLSEVGDLSFITSCLVLPGFLMDTLFSESLYDVWSFVYNLIICDKKVDSSSRFRLGFFFEKAIVKARISILIISRYNPLSLTCSCQNFMSELISESKDFSKLSGSRSPRELAFVKTHGESDDWVIWLINIWKYFTPHGLLAVLKQGSSQVRLHCIFIDGFAQVKPGWSRLSKRQESSKLCVLINSWSLLREAFFVVNRSTTFFV